MIDCNLGPDFKSCFLGHKQSEYGKTFTVRLAKHMCYEDARLVQHFVNQKAMRQWIDAVTDFCEGFLSTLSLRRATALADRTRSEEKISIHALLAESDV